MSFDNSTRSKLHGALPDPSAQRHRLAGGWSDLDQLKFILTCAAIGTRPCFGDVFPSRAGSNALLGKPLRFVIHKSTDHAHIGLHDVARRGLLHCAPPLFLDSLAAAMTAARHFRIFCPRREMHADAPYTGRSPPPTLNWASARTQQYPAHERSANLATPQGRYAADFLGLRWRQ